MPFQVAIVVATFIVTTTAIWLLVFLTSRNRQASTDGVNWRGPA